MPGCSVRDLTIVATRGDGLTAAGLSLVRRELDASAGVGDKEDNDLDAGHSVGTSMCQDNKHG